MLQFLKYVLATVVGLFLFFLLSVFLLAGIGSAIGSATKNTTTVEANSVLKLSLNRPVQELSPERDPFSDLMNDGPAALGLRDLKESILKAKTDANIKGIYLDAEMPMTGFATLEEIRNALLDFKKSGKFVYSYGETMSEQGMYLASVADKIYVMPVGGLELNGLSTQITFMKGLFDKIGVKPEIFRVGQYKSFVEPFIRTDMSPENREQTSSYINSIADHLYGRMAASRGLAKAQLDSVINSGSLLSPQEAVKARVITHEGYLDQFENEIRQKLGTKGEEKINYVTIDKYVDVPSTAEKGSLDNRIAVIVGQGDIVTGKGDPGSSVGSETVIKELRKARKDSKVKAIVLRINSPGGSAIASDAIWREVQLTRKAKPVIASMGDYAASGGYYMAMGCDAIVAQPTTITGSIGIFGILFNAQELLNNKLGLTFDGVKSHQYADSPALTRPMNDAEKAMIQNMVNRGYETFTTKAAQGRKMSVEQLKTLAGGRVWTGQQAKANGLVDVLGGFDEAVALAAQRAGIKNNDYRLKYMTSPKNRFEQLLAKISGDAEEAKLKEYLGIFAPYAQQVKEWQKMDKIQARLPYTEVIQ